MSMLAALFMAGCSQEEIAPNGEDNGNGEANTSLYDRKSDVLGDRPPGRKPWCFRLRGW